MKENQRNTSIESIEEEQKQPVINAVKMVKVFSRENKQKSFINRLKVVSKVESMKRIAQNIKLIHANETLNNELIPGNDKVISKD